MKALRIPRRTLTLIGLLLALLVVFIFVALRSGPLAPIAVTLGTVESRAMSPGIFGIGTVEPRFTYRVGPTIAGRVQRVLVDVGDRVTAGQVIGEMEQHSEPPLTTLDYATVDNGRHLADLLMRQLGGEPAASLTRLEPVHLIARQSDGPCLNA